MTVAARSPSQSMRTHARARGGEAQGRTHGPHASVRGDGGDGAVTETRTGGAVGVTEARRVSQYVGGVLAAAQLRDWRLVTAEASKGAVCAARSPARARAAARLRGVRTRSACVGARRWRWR